MSNKLLCRSPSQLKLFREAIYPLRIAILFDHGPTRLKQAMTFAHFRDVFIEQTQNRTLKAFSVVPIRFHDKVPPLTFAVDHIRKANKIGDLPIRKCTLACDDLQWEGSNVQITDIPDLVEKRLWSHIKNTHLSLFDTFQ